MSVMTVGKDDDEHCRGEFGLEFLRRIHPAVSPPRPLPPYQ